MRAEIHGADGRHVVLTAKDGDLDALVGHAERLYRATGDPAKPAAAAGFTVERDAPELPYDHPYGDRPPLETIDRQET